LERLAERSEYDVPAAGCGLIADAGWSAAQQLDHGGRRPYVAPTITWVYQRPRS
jgi:hypothetical protein